MKLQRYANNPIVVPGPPHWRAVATFNPSVIWHAGEFWMLERAVSNLQPLYSHVGLLRSRDGFHFELAAHEPVFTAAQLRTPRGTVEDPRVVEIEGAFYMTYVHRNFASSCYPTGKGIPNCHNCADVPPGDPKNYRAGLARSRDLRTWEDLGLVTPREVDDRDCVLFPEKIGGRFAMLWRPMGYIGPQYGCDRPSIWLSYSPDLKT